MNALFIGRFQPFHNGHLRVIEFISARYDQVIIGVGSSQYGNTLENPFTVDERKQMIHQSLSDHSLSNYRIVEIPDIHNYPKWVDHVLSIVSDFHVVYANNPLTQRLFQEKGFIVKETPLYNRGRYSGVEIRRRMIMGEPWEDSVPKAVVRIIKTVDGVKRLRDLSQK